VLGSCVGAWCRKLWGLVSFPVLIVSAFLVLLVDTEFLMILSFVLLFDCWPVKLNTHRCNQSTASILIFLNAPVALILVLIDMKC